MYPVNDAEVFRTSIGTPYLKEPGVVMVSAPQFSYSGLEEFLEGFDTQLGFSDYRKDTPLQDYFGRHNGTELCKFAGQTCYMSFGPNRTKNSEAYKYIDNIIKSGHGSVLEHANYSFLIYGVSRSLTHELVRHRAGMAYSQLSQRYVSGKVLRFVERPEYQKDSFLHTEFKIRIDNFANKYERLADYLLKQQKEWLEAVKIPGQEGVYTRTELRKKVQQCSRSLLPNETETVLVCTGNVRAWRNILEQRGSEHAEIEINRLAYKLYRCLFERDPLLFADYEISEGKDGRKVITTNYKKV